MTQLHPKRALLSVSDKSQLIEFAQGLSKLGIEILSTGGTAKTLQQAGIAVTAVSEVTDFPEIMQGRVKTLHPKIFGGILAKREEHQQEVQDHNIPLIDLVVCNLYPFAKTIAKPNVSHSEAVENIDIGGPSMVRAAAKNYDHVAIVVDPKDYEEVLKDCANGMCLETRKHLSAKAFAHTAQYDCMISNYLDPCLFPETLNLSLRKLADLRYGENPHQRASVYVNDNHGILSAQQLQGKALSYNNIADADAALQCVSEFSEPTCVVVKHANPCGVAQADNINNAFQQAWDADSQSAFGGIVALNRPCSNEIATFLQSVFFEVLIAPDYDEKALQVLSQKKNLRLLKLQGDVQPNRLLRSVSGGIICQTPDTSTLSLEHLNNVTKTQASAQAMNDALFAWRVAKHVKSNGIVIAKNQTTRGIGPGQVSRVNAVNIALQKARSATQDAVLASDAFFPFRDNIDLLKGSGISTIIQPGGSIKDQEVIAACNELGIAMLFTGVRVFKH